jgi:hypothetical protein
MKPAKTIMKVGGKLPAFTLVYCSAYSSTLKMEAICSSFSGLHCVISHIFITTAVRTSNPNSLRKVRKVSKKNTLGEVILKGSAGGV